MSATTIRELTLADVAELQAISVETFSDTFAAQNTKENLEAFLQSAYNVPKLTAELQQPDSHFYFIERDGKVLGYLKLNVGADQSEKMGTDSLEVERIYIRPAYKHQGLGSQFMTFAIEQAKAAHKTQIWLGVWEHNEPAKAVYHKWGFEHFSQHAFVMGTDRQTDLLMKKKL